MWESEDSTYAAVKNAELALLSSGVRGDSSQIAALLSEDFAEIGRSGTRWTYADTVAALPDEAPRATPETSEWLFNRVGPGLVLVTYRIHGSPRDSRHSSLWEVPTLTLRFHQGTFVTGE